MTDIQTELQSRLEIVINAHTSYSNNFKFEFRPFMINNANANTHNSNYDYGSSSGYNNGYGMSGRSGTKTRMAFLPISHLVESIFPIFKKRYKKQGMITFTNSEEYLQYVKFANGLLYDEEEEKKVNGTTNSESKYILDKTNYAGMINRNIKFILTELFTKNRILLNVIDNNNNNNNNATRSGSRLNQEYFIETFMMPAPISQNENDIKPKSNTVPIFKDSADEIQKLTKDKTTINGEIAKLERDLKLASSSSSASPENRRNLEFQISQKKLRREKIIQQIFTYTYGEMDIALKENLKRAEAYRADIDRHSSTSPYRNYDPEQELKKINTRLKLRKVHIYIVTISEMSLVPSLLDNGKDNPQFTALRNKMIEGDLFDGRVKSESLFQIPTRAQCASDKRIIERMYDEIFNAKRLLGKSERDDAKRTYVPSNYLEYFKKLFDGIGVNKSSEYFDKTTFTHLTPAYEGTRTVAGGDEDPIMILCRTKMGAFLLFFTLLESDTLKLHRPNISSLDKVRIREVMKPKPKPKPKPENVDKPEDAKTGTGLTGGGDTFEVKLPVNIRVKNLDLILNTNVPPAYFTSNADYRAYNEYKTRDSVYKRFDFFDFRLDSPIDVKNYEAAVKMVGSLIKSVRAEIEEYKLLPAPKPHFEFAVKLESMSSLVRAIKHLTKTEDLQFAVMLRIAERIEEKEKELSKWLLQKNEYDESRSKIIAKYKPTNPSAFIKHMEADFVLNDEYKTKPFDDSYYAARDAIDKTFFDSMNIPVNALTQIAVSKPETNAMIVKINAAYKYAESIRETTRNIVYAFAATTGEKIDDKSTKLLQDVNDLSTKAKDKIIGAATALNLRAQNLVVEIGNALTNLLSIRGFFYGIPLILAGSAEMAILAAGGVVTIAAGAGTLAISIASVMAAMAAASASITAIGGLIAAYEVAEKSLIAVGGIILTSGAIATLSATLMIDAIKIAWRTVKKIIGWLSNKFIEIKNWWRNRDLVKIIENGQKIIARLGDIEAFNAELIDDVSMPDDAHRNDAIIASAEYSKLLTSSDKEAKAKAYKKKVDADKLVAADEANARKISYVFKQIENAFGKITPTTAATAATAATANSKKPESKFNLEFLKGIIDHVEESVDEAEVDETRDVKKMKIIPVPAPVKPVIKKEVGKEVGKEETELTSDELGKKQAAEMEKRGIKVETDSSRGLQNQGQTCYMNAALQFIFSMTKIKDAIQDKKFQDDDDNALHALKQYMQKMSGIKGKYDEKILATAIFKNTKLEGSLNTQNDSQEVVLKLIDKAYDAFKDPNVIDLDNKINELSPEETHVFGIHVLAFGYYAIDNETKATDCRSKQTDYHKKIQYELLNAQDPKRAKLFVYGLNPEYNSQMDLSLPEKDSTFDKIYKDAVYNGELFTDDDISKNAVLTSIKTNCGAAKIFNKNFFKFGKNYIIIQLKRFNNDLSKITTSIDIENSEIPANDGTTDVFRILGCICHDGTKLSGGHYTYVSFTNGIPDKFYNDSAVSDVDATIRENLKKECYVLLFERVTKGGAKAVGGSNQTNVANQAKETRRCRLAAVNRPPPNKYTRRHNKNKDRVVPTVTVIKR